MIERERTREESRERRAGDPAAGFGTGNANQLDYFNVMDDLISSTISSDSESFIQQMQQENGQ